MLVLTRKNGESIEIGDDIKIVVVKSTDSRVRIGVVAPKDVRVLRSEIAEQERNSSND